MKLQFYNKYLATFLICAVWFFAGLVMRGYGTNPDFNQHFMVVFIFASLITFAALHLYRRETNQQQRHRKIEHFLTDLRDEDLEALRERLAFHDDGEYDSLEAMLDQQKRKR